MFWHCCSIFQQYLPFSFQNTNCWSVLTNYRLESFMPLVENNCSLYFCQHCTMANRKGWRTDLCVCISSSPLLLLHFIYSLRFSNNLQLWGKKATASSKTFFQNTEPTAWDWPAQGLCRPSAMASGADKSLAWKIAIFSHFLQSHPWSSFECSMCSNCVYDLVPARQSEQQGVR